MAKRNSPLENVRRICLSFPDTKETLTWGKPHFRVGDKIFAGYGDEEGVPTVGFKLEMDHAAAIIKVPGFQRAPYVGHKGWVSMDATDVQHWELVKELIRESYQLIAPKRSLAKLHGEASKPVSVQGSKSKKATKRNKTNVKGTK